MQKRYFVYILASRYCGTLSTDSSNRPALGAEGE